MPCPPSRSPSSRWLTLDARRGRKRKERLGKPQAHPLRIELAFSKRIGALFDRLAVKAVAVATARARKGLTQDAAADDAAALAKSLKAHADFTLKEAADLAREVANENARQMKRSLALKIPELSHDKVLEHARRTVREVQAIAETLADRIAPVVAQAVSQGVRAEVFAKEIQSRLGIAKKAAERVAIGQVIRINSEVTQERHEALGITDYIWRSTDDQHTRAWHRALNKTRQSYASPPMGGGGGPKDTGHPGSADVCRCQAIPVMPSGELAAAAPPEAAAAAKAKAPLLPEAEAPALAPLDPRALMSLAQSFRRSVPVAVAEREVAGAVERAIASKSLRDLKAIPFTATDLANDQALAFLRRDPVFRRTGNVADNFGSSTGGLPQITIEADGRALLGNGRHRLTVARELGLRQIMARVVRFGPRGGERWEYIGMIRT